MSNNKKPIDIFASMIDTLKKGIIDGIKREKEIFKQLRIAKSENDKYILLDEAKKQIDMVVKYRKVLDDLTYAYVKEYPQYSERIVKRFGYQTIEGFLTDKEDGRMPSLVNVIELIAKGPEEINKVYKRGYTEDGQISLQRSYEISKGNPDAEKLSNVDNAKNVANITYNATKHK